ncbi:hypothetical protein ACFV99_39935 [Streptomyces sp. NPDC059944]|uniref:hypothetical protein n=1 Tax=unclassified Streptomyces TaxID=2593676 RepID=UPI0036441839
MQSTAAPLDPALQAIPRPRHALTAAQAVALSLLRDGYTQRTILARTDTQPGDLYRLAALHAITAPHGTAEGHQCHEARNEEPCTNCGRAYGRVRAREHARQRRSLSALPAGLRRRAQQGRRAAR